jgi:hypothetical protein
MPQHDDAEPKIKKWGKHPQTPVSSILWLVRICRTVADICVAGNFYTEAVAYRVINRLVELTVSAYWHVFTSLSGYIRSSSFVVTTSIRIPYTSPNPTTIHAASNIAIAMLTTTPIIAPRSAG